MIDLSMQEMIEKITAMSDVKIECNKNGNFAYVMDTVVYDGDGNITQFYFAKGCSVEDAVYELFRNLTLHTMHKTVVAETTRTERWYFNKNTQEFEQYTLTAEGGADQC